MGKYWIITNQLFDVLNLGEYSFIDAIIKRVMLKSIPKVSVIIEGITFVIKELQIKQCVIYPNEKS